MVDYQVGVVHELDKIGVLHRLGKGSVKLPGHRRQGVLGSRCHQERGKNPVHTHFLEGRHLGKAGEALVGHKGQVAGLARLDQGSCLTNGHKGHVNSTSDQLLQGRRRPLSRYPGQRGILGPNILEKTQAGKIVGTGPGSTRSLEFAGVLLDIGNQVLHCLER